MLLPGSAAERVADAYRKHLGLGNKTLQDLPDVPRFVFNSTSLQTGSLWRFSKPYMGDWQVGLVQNPAVSLATAVAASSAFPPFLAPLVLRLDPKAVTRVKGCTLHEAPYTERAVLVDGGIYDNLGLETAWKRYRTILVSDAGAGQEPQPAPKGDWLRVTSSVAFLFDHQVRSLRKRQLLDSYVQKTRDGAYWGIGTPISRYPTPGPLSCPADRTQELATTATRLARLDPAYQERLINWGYASCDAALRSHYDTALPMPSGFPYPGGV